jgi:hypothetical protein
MYDEYLYIQLEDQQSGNNILQDDGRIGEAESLLGDMMMEVESYLKSKVISYANTFRADVTNWDSPFSGGVLTEDGTEILLERGGSFLYPSIQFPVGESGVATIDVSFNSDILLEDDNGAYGWGYLLDETSAGQGNGPQRFISLEEDTQGPDRQYESIPIVDTHVMPTLYNSTKKHLLSEDGLDRFMHEDEELLALDNIEVFGEDNSIILGLSHTIATFHRLLMEDGAYITNEDNLLGIPHTYFTLEDEYGLRQNSLTEVEFDLYDTVGWHVIAEDGSHVVHEDNTRLLIEYGQVQDPVGEIEFNLYDTTGWHFLTEDGLTYLRYEDGTRPVTEESHVKDLTVGIEKNYYVRSGQHTIMEDGYHYLYEDETVPQLEEDYFKYTVGELEFSLIDSIRGGFQTEDGADFIVGEGESWLASKLISEQPPITKTPVIIHDLLVSPTGRIIMEDFESLPDDSVVALAGGTLIATEDSGTAPFFYTSYILEEGKFAHKHVMFDASATYKTAWIWATAGTGQHISMEDGYHYLYEDESIPQLEEGYFKYPTGQIEFNLLESLGYHLKFEDDDHVINADGTRVVIDDLEFKPPTIVKHYVTEDAASDLMTWTPENHLLNTISTYKDKYITATYGMQPFRPHYVSQWADAELGFVDDKFRQEDDSGIIVLEHPVTNQDYLLHEDFPELNQDMMNPQRKILDFILLEDYLQTEGAIDGNEVDYLQYEEATITDTFKGTRRPLLETSKREEDGYGVDFAPTQAWTVLPAYRYSRILTRLRGTINFDDGGVVGTGSGSLFTTQLKVGEEFLTADENIISEDSGGGVLLETDERIEHETIIINDMKDEQLTAADFMGIQIRHFRWLITTEDTTVAAHGSHTGVTGEYSTWDTSLTSYWIVTGESNAGQQLGTETNTVGYPGGIEQEGPEWESHNMVWEDNSKQLILEPQAFMVKTITNDTSLTVTRKGMPGGLTDSVYQL